MVSYVIRQGRYSEGVLITQPQIGKEDIKIKKVYPLSLLVAGVLMVIPITGNAQILDGNGAVVIKDTSCTVLGTVFTNGNFTLVPFEVLDSVKVITPSKNYTKNVSCHGDLPDGMDSPPNALCWASATRVYNVVLISMASGYPLLNGMRR